MTGVGAAIGFLAGLALAFGGTAVFRHFPGSEVHPVGGLQPALLAICSAVTVGLVFGTCSARCAARLSAVEAIARE